MENSRPTKLETSESQTLPAPEALNVDWSQCLAPSRLSVPLAAVTICSPFAALASVTPAATQVASVTISDAGYQSAYLERSIGLPISLAGRDMI